MEATCKQLRSSRRGHGNEAGRQWSIESAKWQTVNISLVLFLQQMQSVKHWIKHERPVIIVRHGVSDKAVRDQLFTLARQWKIPVITSVLEMSALSWDDPLNFGCIGGAYGHRYANMIANAKSDLLICLGISLCTRQIGTKVHEFAKNAKNHPSRY